MRRKLRNMGAFAEAERFDRKGRRSSNEVVLDRGWRWPEPDCPDAAEREGCQIRHP